MDQAMAAGRAELSKNGILKNVIRPPKMGLDDTPGGKHYVP